METWDQIAWVENAGPNFTGVENAGPPSMERDATFWVVPLSFYQLFTVFVQHTDHSPALYQGVFEMLHELLSDFQPNHVIADFEEAPATATRVVFGDAVTVSCF